MLTMPRLNPLVLAMSFLLAGFSTAASQAAGRDGLDRQSPERFDRIVAGKLVERIQQSLSELGYYLGPISGVGDSSLEAAIRLYQEESDLPIDGQPSVRLAGHLAQSVKMAALVERLTKSRKQGEAEARARLLSNPLTRDLVTRLNQPEAPSETAPDSALAPIPRSCLAFPMPECLLKIAAADARLIEKQDQRDWALGELLIAQTHAGLNDDALLSTRRIRDPRLIMAALRDIAKTQAQAGLGEDALFAAEIIPDTAKQMEALVTIADAQTSKDDKETAMRTTELLSSMLRRVEEPMIKVTFETKVAILLNRLGALAGSKAALEAAEQTARKKLSGARLNTGLRLIANALAETGDPDHALRILKDVPPGADQISVKLSAATAQARRGRLEQARETIGSIQRPRFELLGLARLASAYMKRGRFEEARVLLDEALKKSNLVKAPYARSYAISRIVRVLADWARLQEEREAAYAEVIKVTAMVENARLRAEVLYELTDSLKAGDTPGDIVDYFANAARSAAKSVESSLNYVWMHSELAEHRAMEGDAARAWEAIGRAMERLQTMIDPWARSRALSKLALTLSRAAADLPEQ